MATVTVTTVQPAAQAAASPVIQISEAGDIILRTSFPKGKVINFAGFKVSRDVLAANSEKLNSQLRNSLNVLEVTGSAIGMEIWLRAIHDVSMPEVHYRIHPKTVWQVIEINKKYGMSTEVNKGLKKWFAQYYNTSVRDDLKPAKSLILTYPCCVFDHPEGFMKLTKFLAYNTSGLISIDYPTTDQELLAGAKLFEAPTTGARAHLQAIIQSKLAGPLEIFHSPNRANCTCRKETAFDYEDALRAVNIWPLHRLFQREPVATIVEKLKGFKFTPNTTNCPSGACVLTSEKSMNIAMHRAMVDFDGLCLDCMKRSIPTPGMSDAEYMQNNSPYKGTCWDDGCRFGHGRSSWCYSWKGPMSKRSEILAKRSAEMREYRKAKHGRGVPGGRKNGVAAHRIEEEENDEFYDAEEQVGLEGEDGLAHGNDD